MFDIFKGIKTTTLENGLKVITYEDKTFDSYYMSYNIRYGSNDFFYFKNNKEIKHKPGIAHFLEHVMFNIKSGDAFAKFSQNQANANAYTSNTRTSYLFSAEDNILENMEILIEMVSSLFLDDEKLKKEVEIINEEIKMYDKDINWQHYKETLRNIFLKNQYREDILGYIGEIDKITLKDLDEVFTDFYNVNNTYIILVGPSLEDKISKLNEISNKYFDIPENNEINKTSILESDFEDRKQVIVNEDITSNYYTRSFKIPFKKNINREEKVLYNIFIDLYLANFYTEINKEYNRLKEDKVLDFSFSYDYFILENELTINFYFTQNEEKLVSIINQYLSRQQLIENLELIENEDLVAMKNKKIGNLVYKFNQPKLLAEVIARVEEREITINKYLEIMENFDEKTLCTIINNLEKTNAAEINTIICKNDIINLS